MNPEYLLQLLAVILPIVGGSGGLFAFLSNRTMKKVEAASAAQREESDRNKLIGKVRITLERVNHKSQELFNDQTLYLGFAYSRGNDKKEVGNRSDLLQTRTEMLDDIADTLSEVIVNIYDKKISEDDVLKEIAAANKEAARIKSLKGNS